MKRPKKLIKPVNGRQVVKPDGQSTLATTGEMLTLTPYWLRRETDGAVTISDRPKRSAASSPKKEES